MPQPTITQDSKILALVPHFRCEDWLGQALESLAQQTRRLDGICVIDDGSLVPPTGIVRYFPEVTLMASKENVGPYRLVQQVISNTRYDGYLFQDADDWSLPRRLEALLTEAEATGAELVGSWETRILEDESQIRIAYPREVNAVLWDNPDRHPLLHPSSLVSRRLVMRVGGYATMMRFGGDSEFLRRAVHIARVVNVQETCYVRRRRLDSLVNSPETGMKSNERLGMRHLWRQKAIANAARIAKGDPPDLSPYATAGAVELKHLLGPPLLKTD